MIGVIVMLFKIAVLLAFSDIIVGGVFVIGNLLLPENNRIVDDFSGPVAVERYIFIKC